MLSSRAVAQEYKYEIGAMTGVTGYMGDANKLNPLQNLRPAVAALFRYNKNFRWAYKADLALGFAAGDTRNSGDVFPYNGEAQFSRTFIEAGFQVEYNFFNYSDKYAFLGTKPYAPYLFTGIGATAAFGDKLFGALNIPIGIGIKYKWQERLNLGLELSYRKLLGDGFDTPSNSQMSLNSPYGIESSLFKNKDWYSLIIISLTWDFGMRTDFCPNID